MLFVSRQLLAMLLLGDALVTIGPRTPALRSALSYSHRARRLGITTRVLRGEGLFPASLYIFYD